MTLGLGLLTEHERLAAANNLNTTELAFGAFKTNSDLLGGLGLLAEDGLSLATETGLLGVVATVTLGVASSLTLLVL